MRSQQSHLLSYFAIAISILSTVFSAPIASETAYSSDLSTSIPGTTKLPQSGRTLLTRAANPYSAGGRGGYHVAVHREPVGIPISRYASIRKNNEWVKLDSEWQLQLYKKYREDSHIETASEFDHVISLIEGSIPTVDSILNMLKNNHIISLGNQDSLNRLSGKLVKDWEAIVNEQARLRPIIESQSLKGLEVARPVREL